MVKERDKQRVASEEIYREVQEADEGKTRRAWDRYLDASLGLRDYWYPAFFSQELQDGATRSETICGERIYFKRVKGKVYGIEDRCPHRGVAFSARPECYTTNTTTCWLHGFTFDVRDGKLTTVLTETDSALEGKLHVKTYPTYERYATVFVWIGDGEPVPPEHDMLPTFMRENLIVKPLVRVKIRCNWRMAAENGFDPGHLYGHRNWAWAKRYAAMPLGTQPLDKSDSIVIDTPGKPKGLLVQNRGSTWVNTIKDGDEVAEVYNPALDPTNPPPFEQKLYPDTFGCFLPCGLDVAGFPRPGLYHWEWYVPIDENHHMYTILQGGEGATAEQREEFLREHEEYLSEAIFRPDGMQPEGFNNFDPFGRQEINQSYMREDWWHRERMYKPDYAIIQWRTLVAKHARGIQKWGNWQPKMPDEKWDVVFYTRGNTNSNLPK